MSAINDYYLFIISGILLNLTPGVDVLYILSSAFQKGFKASIVAILGINTGCLIHMFISIIGLSAILMSSVYIFNIIKFLGLLYLVYLGLSLLFSKNDNRTSSKKIDKSLMKIYYKGIFINVLNPKVMIFFLAFLPQFINTSSSEASFALSILGLSFILVGIIINILISYVALNISKNFNITNKIKKLLKNLVGGLFIGFAIKLGFDV